jgi:hypothetical protein
MEASKQAIASHIVYLRNFGKPNSCCYVFSRNLCGEVHMGAICVSLKRSVLEVLNRPVPELQDDRLLYLAVPLEAYETFFQSRFAQVAVERHQLKLIVYEPVTEEIMQWIS